MAWIQGTMNISPRVGDKEITAVADIADALAESFSEIFSNKHYSSKFQSHKANAERQTLKFNLRLSNFIILFIHIKHYF